MSIEICEASRYTTTPSLTAVHTSEHNQEFGSITVKPGMERSSLRIVVLHFDIGLLAKHAGISRAGCGVSVM